MAIRRLLVYRMPSLASRAKRTAALARKSLMIQLLTYYSCEYVSSDVNGI